MWAGARDRNAPLPVSNQTAAGRSRLSVRSAVYHVINVVRLRGQAIEPDRFSACQLANLTNTGSPEKSPAGQGGASRNNSSVGVASPT
jgi:hypothetical protein